MGGREESSGPEPSRSAKLSAATFYALSSIMIMAANKVTLTTYRFPSSSTVAFAQLVVTLVLLRIAKAGGAVQFPDFSISVVRKVFPLPLIYLGNVVTGLSGTKALSLPMFTVLRRFSILFTLIAESFLLRNKHSIAIRASVGIMLLGALIAAADDLAFDAMGYIWVLSSDLFTAMNGVYIKQKLDAKDLGSSGLMFYNCLCSLPVVLVVMHLDGSVEKVTNFDMLFEPTFQVFFFLSSVMGCILTYSVYLCTQVNSALTTAVVGCLKNVLISYGGMFIGGDYIFSLWNFAGLNISVLGSVYYSYLQIVKKSGKSSTPLPTTRAVSRTNTVNSPTEHDGDNKP